MAFVINSVMIMHECFLSACAHCIHAASGIEHMLQVSPGCEIQLPQPWPPPSISSVFSSHARSIHSSIPPSLHRGPLGVLLGSNLLATDCHWKTGCVDFFLSPLLALVGHARGAAALYFWTSTASHLQLIFLFVMCCLHYRGSTPERTFWMHWWFTSNGE